MINSFYRYYITCVCDLLASSFNNLKNKLKVLANMYDFFDAITPGCLISLIFYVFACN